MLDGIGISGYRSFGSTEVKVQDLTRINIFVGKNNCGKSNILRFVKHLAGVYKGITQGHSVPQLDPFLDYCLGDQGKKVTVGLEIKRGAYGAAIYDHIAQWFAKAQVPFPDFPEPLWFHFNPSENMEPTNESLRCWQDLIHEHCAPGSTNSLTNVMCNYSGGSPEKRAIDIARWMHKAVELNLEVHLIEAFRKIADSGQDKLSGAGLIQELRKLQSPELAVYETSRRRFENIVAFVRSVLGEPNAEMEIPAGKDEIYVKIGNKRLPLPSLGSGIHQLIILASAVTVVDNVVFCIEEPEIHLHPELQKKFTQYIATHTSNQYLIASHSNALFDLPGVNIYRCWLEDEYTRCELASRASDKHAVLLDLGYKPSDLLQANYVIWVEGPSDRVYLNYWIGTKEPLFVEGLHYAIMFYGGRLLSHLSYELAAGDDSTVNDFIRLSCFNRNAAPGPKV